MEDVSKSNQECQIIFISHTVHIHIENSIHTGFDFALPLPCHVTGLRRARAMAYSVALHLSLSPLPPS